MPFITRGDSRLYFEDHGEGAAIVLAHGVGGNHAIWFRQIHVLAASYRVIVIDQRGFGLSTDVERLGRAAFADDLLALLDHLGIERAVLVGQSMGGGTCINLAAAHPERVAALVLASSLHGIEEDESVARIMAAARGETETMDQIERVLGAAHRDANPADATLYRGIASFNATDRLDLPGEWPRIVAPAELATGMPVMFIAGVEDRIFPIDAIRHVQSEVPGSFLVEVSSGHSVFLEQPDTFNDSLLSFLAASGIRGRRRAQHSNAAGYAAVSG